MSDTLNILVQSSNYYAPMAGVMLTSLFENNQNITNINVYLLTSDMSQKNRDRFLALAEQYHRIVRFLDANKWEKKAVILHCFLIMTMYTWNIGNLHPVKDLWWQYMDDSPWRDFNLIKSSKEFAINCFHANYMFLHIGLY